ncbi:VanZ family protein [Companilactobacillus nodensis]|nr:VanZ family protein [Companilactobacillus nodensis]
MRWIPLLVILVLSFLSGNYIIHNIEDFNKKRMSLLSLVYMTLLGAILFTPMSFNGIDAYVMPAGVGRVNLYHIYYDVGFFENIILTIPLGFLIKKSFTELSIVSMIPVGLMIGAAIETMQYYLSHAFLINRTSDISDVVANGIGIVVGSILLLIYQQTYEKQLLNNRI